MSVLITNGTGRTSHGIAGYIVLEGGSRVRAQADGCKGPVRDASLDPL